MKLTSQQIAKFQEVVWQYFNAHQRPMPWRENPNAYNVLVSEIMLQQTQVPRVITKFHEFMLRFPDIRTLAAAPLSDVLIAWNGLGYNRRAKFLHEASKKIVGDFKGSIPNTLEELIELPGIGKNTAGAILAYAYDQPEVFIETNVRTVLFHHFFDGQDEKVSDKELAKIADQVLDREHPREWYWALMDYGAYLKKTAGGRLDSSRHYKKQAPLKGSLREMRGRILKALTSGPLTKKGLRDAVRADERYEQALDNLVDEGMIVQNDNMIRLTGHADA